MNVDIAMKRLRIAAAALFAGIGLTHAQDGVDKARADAFEVRMFAGQPGKKAYACFLRRYDANHLAQHPKQKIAAMKLLVGSAEGRELGQLLLPPWRQISSPFRRFRLQRFLRPYRC
jgi:hypothetical protein